LTLGLAAVAISLSAATLPAAATHRCGLDRVSHTVNTICENYHSPKVLVQYVACIATGNCPIG
jgi:hypothetical protein